MLRALASFLLIFVVLMIWKTQGGSAKDNDANGVVRTMRGSTPGPMPVVFVEQHGNVLQHWLRNMAPRPVSLVHVDSHSDMMSVEDSQGFLGSPDMILKNPEIGDFITRAVVAGKLVSVHWIRSDFNIGFYNGPNIGHWKIRAGLSDEMACFISCERIGNDFDDFPETDVEQLESCDESEVDRIVDAEIIVSKLDALVEYPRNRGDWILDIDMDFFATNDPSIALFESFGFSREWVEENFLGVFSCPEMDDAREITQLRKISLYLIRKRDISTKTALKIIEEVDGNCQIQDLQKFRKLLQALKRFDEAELECWGKLWNMDILGWTGDFITTIASSGAVLGPVGLPSKREIELEAKRLQKFIKDEVKLRSKGPLCVTISKSKKFDHYLPESRADFIEEITYGILKETFQNLKIERHPDFSFEKETH